MIAFVDSATVEALSNTEFVSLEEISSGDNSPNPEEASPEPPQVESLPPQSGEIFGTPEGDVLVGDNVPHINSQK